LEGGVNEANLALFNRRINRRGLGASKRLDHRRGGLIERGQVVKTRIVPMRQMLHAVTAACAAVALVCLAGVAAAQAPIKQIRLTEKQVQSFIAAQKDMAAVAEKMQESASDQPDPKVQAELETIAKKHGFKDFAEYDDVANNIMMVMGGIDPQTKQYIDPQTAIKKEMAEVRADKTLPEKDKKDLLHELEEALKTAQPIQFPSNVELVKKYYDKIDAAL
jgi:hypothetical protein